MAKRRKQPPFFSKHVRYGAALSGIVLILTGLFTYSVERIERRAINTEFSARAQQVSTLIERNLSDYRRILIGASGLFASSEEVTRDEWATFAQSQGLDESFPEILAISFVEYVRAPELAAFEERVRAEGYPNFAVTPVTNNSDHFVGNYIEPWTGENAAFGFDLGSNPDRRSALEEARDTNNFILTAPLSLQGNGTTGFLGILPVYTNDADVSTIQSRRANLEGVILTVFALDQLFENTTENSSENLGIDYHVVDIEADTVIFNSALLNGPVLVDEENAEFIGSIETGSRNWQLRATPNRIFNDQFARERLFPIIVLVSGSVISLAIFIFFVLLDRSRRLAVKLADKMTANYKREKRKVERTLERVQEERDKIDTIVEGIGDGLFVIDDKKKIFLFNPSAEKITGFKRDDILGKPFKDFVKLISPSKKQTAAALIRRVATFKSLKEMSVKTQISRKNGKRITIAATMTPILDRKKKITGAVVVFRDVSREAAIDKAKTEFVSLASHQLRSPITSVKQGLESVLDGDFGKLNKKQTTLFKEMHGIADSMATLVSGFLDVSRLDLGTFPIKLEKLDIVKMAKTILKELKTDIATKELKVKAEFADLPKIESDENVINIILQNLLTNAIKYTPAKGTIHVSIKQKNGKILIQVADSGYGIPDDQQDKIFTKLFRADNVQEKVSGTGLGLYTTKGVVEQSGGKIWFESKEDEGTIFYVTLPKKSKAKEYKKK